MRSCHLPSLLPIICVALAGAGTTSSSGPAPARDSVFCPQELTRAAQDNAARLPWAAAMREQVVAAARPWMEMSEDELWGLMFGHTITRSWMVWSNGHCPACGEDVPMYNWEIDAIARPWKVRC
ncbi:MAG: hypothetical protein AB7Y46_09555, partial [Armatimonadota bacterium]